MVDGFFVFKTVLRPHRARRPTEAALAMSDDTKPGATQGDDQQDDQNDQHQHDDLDKVDGLGDAGKEAIRKERERAASAEKARRDADKQIRDLSKRLKDFEDKDKTEIEKATGERDEALKTVAEYRDKYRKLSAAEVVRTEAIRLGADPRRVDRIVRMVRPDLEFDDDGDEPTNVKTLLAELRKTDDDLFKPVVGKGDGGAGNNGKPKSGDFMRAAYTSSRGSGG
jgi:hypothetical protein